MGGENRLNINAYLRDQVRRRRRRRRRCRRRRRRRRPAVYPRDVVPTSSTSCSEKGAITRSMCEL